MFANLEVHTGEYINKKPNIMLKVVLKNHTVFGTKHLVVLQKQII